MLTKLKLNVYPGTVILFYISICFPDKKHKKKNPQHNSSLTDDIDIVFIIKGSRQQQLLNAFGNKAELHSLVESQDKTILHSSQSSIVLDEKYTQSDL